MGVLHEKHFLGLLLPWNPSLYISLVPSPQSVWICPSRPAPALAPEYHYSSVYVTQQLEIPWDWDLAPEPNG